MAHASFAFFLITIALILFATANPLAHAVQLNVTGRLCCSRTGNCPGQGVPGVDVGLNCIGASAEVSQNVTDAVGRFNINTSFDADFGAGNGAILPCFATVQLPLNRTVCPILSTSNRTLVGGVQVGTVMGEILMANVAGFIDVEV